MPADSSKYRKQYYQQHKELQKERALLYYYANYPTVKERNNATAKAYYWANREKILARRRALSTSAKVYPRKSALPPQKTASPPLHERKDPFRLDFGR